MSTAIHQQRPPSRILDPEGPLLLCAPAVQHTPSLVRAIHASLPALRGYMPFAHLTQDEDTQYTRLAQVSADYWRGDDYHMHLFDPRAPDEVLGCVGLHRRTLHRHGLEVGYWVRSSHAGQGLCTRAARMAVVLAITHFACDRVQCAFDPTNGASARVAEKVGFEVQAELPGFGPPGTDAMRAAGWRASGQIRLTALDPARARAQPWWAPMCARLQWWDWRGEPVVGLGQA